MTDTDNVGVAFHPPLLLLGSIVAGFAVRWLAPLTFLPEALTFSVGLPVTAISFALFFWAVGTMRGSGASIPTNEPTAFIVSGGPYGFSRNPIYLSMLLLQVGIAFWANSLWFIGIAGVSALLLVWGVIRREEWYLERKFGEDYVAYRTRVRRWL